MKRKDCYAMARSMQRYIDEYRKTFCGRKDTLGAIYLPDVDEIYRLNEGKSIFDAISNAMYAGFMIGYKCAKGRAKAARAKASKAAAEDPRLQLIAQIRKQLDNAPEDMLRAISWLLAG